MLRFVRLAALALFFFVLVSLPCGLSSVCAQEEESVRVFNALTPSVVALQNEEGSGTGILLDSTGLILTNAHVVASPLPYTCKVDVLKGDKLENVTFKRVKLLGFHPSFDMALVRIDPKEHDGQLKPAHLAEKKAIQGQHVYVLGNPGGAGQILEKTFTEGMITGVDRKVEGEKGASYYQTNAAINPGNSGGPMVDKQGNVLGMVTLKAKEVEGVGFALPLYDLNPEIFVPLVKRFGDPKQAKELLEFADNLINEAQKAQKQGGDRHPAVLYFRGMAAHALHMALTYDPGNDGLYYKVGMLMRGVNPKMEPAASAYLLQAIQLKPWGNGNADYYRDLGSSLLDQYANEQKANEKKAEDQKTHEHPFDDAVQAWEEGQAKFPMQCGTIWETIAKYWMDDARQPDKAAYPAAVAVHLKNQGTDVDRMQALIQAARAQMAEGQRKELDEKIAKIDDMLREGQAKADESQKANKAFVTAPFLAYVEKQGSFSQEDTSGAVAKIEPPHITPPETTTPKVTTPKETPKKPEPKAVSLDLSIPKGSTNLLHGIKFQRDAVKGTWKLEKQAIVTPLAPYARLQVPATLPPEYDLTLIVERKNNKKEFVVGFSRGGTLSAFQIDADDSSSSYIDPHGREIHDGQVLPMNQPVTLVCKVRKEGLLVMADGEKIFFDRPSGAFPDVPEDWAVPDTAKLFLGANASKFIVHKMMLTPYTRAKKP